ncbi:MAG: caspase family protein, partial [Hyphomicrobiales bacterium]|nr:caspase family protein [Hyphomicrobiales bacterium]
MMRNRLAVLAVTLAFVLVPSALTAEERIALIIGNANYASSPLKNPRNDAELMAGTLKAVGFKVTTLIDADQKAMKRAMIAFGRKLRVGNSVGLFYYAGHGVQVEGENFLIPIGADIADATEVGVEGVSVNDFLRTMERAASR